MCTITSLSGLGGRLSPVFVYEQDKQKQVTGGKSEQGRARWWLTATRSDPRESATEKTRPMTL